MQKTDHKEYAEQLHVQSENIKVWDPFVRLFHWSLVFFFILTFVTEDDFLTIHINAGYTVAGLVLFRLIWGFIGTYHARFNTFVTGPAKVWSYLKSLRNRDAPSYLGHNPAGGAMIIALLVFLTMTVLSGMVLIAGEGSGPFAGTSLALLQGEWIEELHEFFANATLFLVVVHVAGVLYGSYVHRENLIRAMLTGYKNGHEHEKHTVNKMDQIISER